MFEVLFLYKVETSAKIVTIEIRSLNIKTNLFEEIHCLNNIIYLLDKKHAQKRKIYVKKLQKILKEHGNII